jgi:hypothetical protein
MLRLSPFVFVLTAGARWYWPDDRPDSGSIADAIRQKQPFRGEMIEFLRDHFTEIRQADEIMTPSTRADAK